jgi:hypothetical protein
MPTFAYPWERGCRLFLPFTNLSGDKDNEYFSDGLTEEMISSLTVIGRRLEYLFGELWNPTQTLLTCFFDMLFSIFGLKGG